MSLTLAYSKSTPTSPKKMLRCALPLTTSQSNSSALPASSKLDRLRAENPVLAGVVDHLIDRFLEDTK